MGIEVVSQLDCPTVAAPFQPARCRTHFPSHYNLDRAPCDNTGTFV